MCFILLGDVGGTNIRLYLIESDYDLKNFHCKLTRNYHQHTSVMMNGEKKSIQTYTNMSQPLHDFLAEFSKIFIENIKKKPEEEQKIIMENPSYNTYTKRNISEDGQITESEEKYLRFWTGEPMEYKDPKQSLFRLFAAIAIAGNPVKNVIEKLANIKWDRVDGDEIKKKFNMGSFYLLNDFHANGFGVLSLKKSNLNLINKKVVKKAERDLKKRRQIENKKLNAQEKNYLSNLQKEDKEFTIVMGMGTGLGVVGIMTRKQRKNQITEKKNKKENEKISLFLNPEAKQDHMKNVIKSEVFDQNVFVMPSEGGHVAFPFFESKDNFDMDFQKFVKKQKGIDFSFLSQELIYCGQGVPFLFQFINLLRKTGDISKPNGKEIFDMAMNGNEIAVATYEKFLEYLGISMYAVSVMYAKVDNFVLVGNIINGVYRKLYKNKKPRFWELVSKRLLFKSHFKKMLMLSLIHI